MLRWVVWSVLLLVNSLVWGQEIKQQVAGRVFDDYRTPLSGAIITLSGQGTILTTSSDDQGGFQFDQVLVGRYAARVFFVGYLPYEEEFVITSGRRIQMEVRLLESSTLLSDVTVAADSLPSSSAVRTISIEKTMRVPANFFDPVRMVTSYPGVVASNDQSNSIIVKGYTPNGLLWRLQGLDIVNPNHLANAGTLSDKPVANGGGVNVLSAQLLDKTDFYSGNFPTRVGNALSGVLDMSLRPGDKNKTHVTAQASLIGMDVAAETPIIRGKSSLLANYRYSTVGLLTNLGVNFGGEEISFQDFSFHYHHNQANQAQLSVFGFGGLSANRFKHKPQTEWKEEKDRYDIDYEGKVFGIGFTEQLPLGKGTVLQLGTAYSGQFQTRISQSQPVAITHLGSDNYENNRTLSSSYAYVTRRLSKRASLEGGMYANFIDHQLGNVSNMVISGLNFLERTSANINGWLLQPYVSSLLKLTSRLQLQTGLRYVNFSFDRSQSLEPRSELTYIGRAGTLQLQYGITSQAQPIQVYAAAANTTLGLVRAAQWNLGYARNFARELRVTSSLYYHQQSKVAADARISFYSLNAIEEMANDALSPVGKGRNYGWEFFTEKKFVRQVYLGAGGALYRAEYLNANGVYQASRFDGKFTFNALGGKEWNRKKNVLGVHARLLYLGGLREREIDPVASRFLGATQYDLTKGYARVLPNYFRTDVRMSWRKNKQRYTRTISIDIQNLTGQENVAYHYYDTFTQSVRARYQLSVIPVLVYRVDW